MYFELLFNFSERSSWPYALRTISTAVLSLVIIEVYSTSLFGNKVVTSFLWCGQRLRAFCKASCAQAYAPSRLLHDGFLS